MGLQKETQSRCNQRMPDIFTVEKRSSVMAAIRSSRNEATELRLIRLFREWRVTGWRRRAKLPGSPDFVFRKARVAIFVDGCFWHGCPLHGRQPKANRSYWAPKLKKNRERDKEADVSLRAAGWRVLRIWEHELLHPPKILRRVRALLGHDNPS